MEYFDVVNEKDEIIGKAGRDECHSNPDLIHRTVHFTLADKNNKRIFITQRSFLKPNDAGKWCFSGEHVLSGENYEEAVIRGVKEELGFVHTLVKEVANHIYSYAKRTEFVRFFMVEINDENIKFDKEEIIKTLWISPNKLMKNDFDLSEMTRYWIKNVNWKIIF